KQVPVSCCVSGTRPGWMASLHQQIEPPSATPPAPIGAGPRKKAGAQMAPMRWSPSGPPVCIWFTVPTVATGPEGGGDCAAAAHEMASDRTSDANCVLRWMHVMVELPVRDSRDGCL